jgi:hypothetical protein
MELNGAGKVSGYVDRGHEDAAFVAVDERVRFKIEMYFMVVFMGKSVR